MKPQILGTSRQNRPIVYSSFGSGPISVLLLGGVHGDEVEGFTCVEKLEQQILQGDYTLPAQITLHICPRVNPDGCATLQRGNANSVDLNRNMPTANWTAETTNPRYFPGSAPGSEPETTVLVDRIEKLSPRLILTLHSYEKPMVNYDGNQSAEVALRMSEKNGLPAKSHIGYPTPGSLGTYAGIERKIPIITLEILKGQNLDLVWSLHRDALIAGIDWAANL